MIKVVYKLRAHKILNKYQFYELLFNSYKNNEVEKDNKKEGEREREREREREGTISTKIY